LEELTGGGKKEYINLIVSGISRNKTKRRRERDGRGGLKSCGMKK